MSEAFLRLESGVTSASLTSSNQDECDAVIDRMMNVCNELAHTRDGKDFGTKSKYEINLIDQVNLSLKPSQTVEGGSRVLVLKK